jgi:hypothetical protein
MQRRARLARLLLAAFVLASSTEGAYAAGCELAVGAQERWYPDAAVTRSDYAHVGSVSGELSCSHSAGNSTVSARVFGRWAQHDSALSHADVRELYWRWTRGPWQVRVGVDRVFWGVTEFAHLVDIVNQADVLEDPFGDAKAGQPMLAATASGKWGALSGYLLPGFRDRLFPGRTEPMRPAPPLELAPAGFQSSRGRSHTDGAVRYSLAKGPIDLGVSYFRGTSRDPEFRIAVPDSGAPRALAHYPLISQAGMDLQLTLDEWIFKMERAERRTAGRTVGAVTVGAEYGFTGVAGTNADLTAVLEYVRDRRQPPPAPGFLDDDWAFGLRLSANDVRTTEVRLGLTSDRHSRSQAWQIRFSSRVAPQWRLESQARVFRRVSPRDPLYLLHDDSYLELTLTRYFIGSTT